MTQGQIELDRQKANLILYPPLFTPRDLLARELLANVKKRVGRGRLAGQGERGREGISLSQTFAVNKSYLSFPGLPASLSGRSYCSCR